MEEAAEPLFRVYVVDLRGCQYFPFWRCGPSYISQDLPPQLLARLESLQGSLVLRNAFLLAVDALEGVGEVRGSNRRLGDVSLHLFLLGLQVESLRFFALLVLLFLVLFRIAERLDSARDWGTGER